MSLAVPGSSQLLLSGDVSERAARRLQRLQLSSKKQLLFRLLSGVVSPPGVTGVKDSSVTEQRIKIIIDRSFAARLKHIDPSGAGEARTRRDILLLFGVLSFLSASPQACRGMLEGC